MVSVTRRRFVAYSAVAAGALSAHAVRAAFADTGQTSGSDTLAAAGVDATTLRSFASQTKGRVLTPESSEYESSRLVFNRAFDKRPALIVYCASADDVARTLEFAQQHKLPLAVRGGGHNRAGLSSCAGGILVDLSSMNRVEVDAGERVARAQAGALTVHLDAATQRLGLATPLAGCPTVGIAGLTLGGGEGFLMPKYGVTCDNLILAQLVTADGRLVKASQDSNPDLFWAIRGGGGNFGVATDLEYRLHPVGAVLAGRLLYPPGRINELVPAFVKFAAALPDDIYAVATVTTLEQGPQLQISLCHFGDPRQGNDLLRPVRALGPQEDSVRVGSFLETQATLFRAAPVAHFQTDLFLELSNPAIATIVAATTEAPVNTRVFLQPFYGAVTRVKQSDTAYALRQPGYEVDIMGRWENSDGQRAVIQWVTALRDRLHPFARGTYVNQLGETSEELVRLAYGPNYSRLAAVKKKYDPHNVLCSNQNVRPA